MSVTIYFINTITGLEKSFNTLCDEMIEIKTVKKHISDESIITQIIAAGGLTKTVRRRFSENVISAEQAGADIIQVTCSSVTPLIEYAQMLVDVPVLSIDGPMAEAVTADYSKIGILATNPGTLNPSLQLLEKTADRINKKIEIETVLCGSAYDAMFSGNNKLHDGIVLTELKNLMERVDAVVLAQASTARVADMLTEKEKRVPVFTSPSFAVKHLAKTITKIRRDGYETKQI
ncbi:MAG: aspartate/glutamate racemase family protein [Spirochaetia bacterium]|jgi:aspartate/glutamate racemase|nr:aspartate/glutamate racemase family protein [Spirochaetia bacterium]